MSRRRVLSTLAFGAALLAGATAMANVKGRVQAEVALYGEAWVGQQIDVHLELRTTGYNFGDTQINLPQVTGGFLMQVDTTTIKMTEQANGESWQIVRYPLAFFPHRAGRLQIPPIKVSFDSASSFGTAPRTFDLQTQTLNLNAQMPPGVTAGASVVSTSDFELTWEWRPAPGEDHSVNGQEGDAVKLSITREAANISGMLLDPLPVFETEGLRAYRDAPEVNDQVNRGDLTGRRVDSVTWMVERAGTYRWPEVQIQWWDPTTEQLREKVIPGLILQAAGHAAGATVEAVHPVTNARLNWRLAVIANALLVLAWLAAIRWREAFGEWLQRRRTGLRRAFSVYHLPPLNPRA